MTASARLSGVTGRMPADRIALKSSKAAMYRLYSAQVTSHFPIQ